MGSDYSTFLFGSPSVFEGAGRILDFGDVLTEFNYSPAGRADHIAITMDWMAVGGDMHAAIDTVKASGGRRQKCVSDKRPRHPK